MLQWSSLTVWLTSLLLSSKLANLWVMEDPFISLPLPFKMLQILGLSLSYSMSVSAYPTFLLHSLQYSLQKAYKNYWNDAGTCKLDLGLYWNVSIQIVLHITSEVLEDSYCSWNLASDLKSSFEYHCVFVLSLVFSALVFIKNIVGDWLRHSVEPLHMVCQFIFCKAQVYDLPSSNAD